MGEGYRGRQEFWRVIDGNLANAQTHFGEYSISDTVLSNTHALAVNVFIIV